MTDSGYMDPRYKREVAALAAMEASAERFGAAGGPSPALLKRQRAKVRKLRNEHKARSMSGVRPRVGRVLMSSREVSFEDVKRWPVEPLPTVPSDARGVIVYDPGLDVLLCVPCQREAGPEGHAELIHPRPATSADMRRLRCCTSCGRDFSEALQA